MQPIPKIKPKRNQAYLNFIRSKPCIVCGAKAEAHHIRRSYWGAGTSMKPHDYVTIPLCSDHHKPESENHFVRIECQIIDYLMEYVGRIETREIK